MHGEFNGYKPDDLKPSLKAFDEKQLYARVRDRDYRVATSLWAGSPRFGE